MNNNQSSQPQSFTKKERWELRKQEKQKFQEIQQKNRWVKGVGFWGIAVFIIGSLGYGVVYLATRPEKSMPGISFPILGREHIPVGTFHPEYNSNPPTSGSHYAKEAEWGVYQNELPDEQLIHNLEHGGIWISYKSDIAPAIKAKLESIGNRYKESVIVTPRAKNDSMIAVASWGRLEKLDTFDETEIINFIDANKNKSPEPLAR
ncbi:MAG: DUF3105 domain-containing protein [Candidatus Liptonbacteria bacterium]|nr:DUF3105 domain-containing protein [Candidatus Liptonbacteria bacterium]